MSLQTALKVESNVNHTRVTTLGHLGMGTGDWRPFDQVFSRGELTSPEEIKKGAEIDALIIWGGEDISPSLYNDTPSDYTGASKLLSRRDQLEAAAFYEAVKRGIPVIGICRGAQLVCALSGGRLIQHVNNHGVTHPMKTVDGRVLDTSSMHHQMMFPYDLPEASYELLAWAHPARSTKYLVSADNHEERGMELREEPEVVWFPLSKSLAIQGHPEFHRSPEKDPFVQYCMELTRKYILGKE